MQKASFAKIKKVSRDTVGRKVFRIINAIILIVVSITFVCPYLNILAKALNKSKDTMLGGITFYPRAFTWDNFDIIIKDPGIWSGFKITLARVITGTFVSLLLDYSAAYVLLRKNLKFKRGIILFLTIPMFIGGGLISEFIIYAKLGVYNTFLVYILPTSFSFYNMVVMRTYLQGIPESLMESARLDGAGEFTVLFKIMLPLSMPIIATVALWLAVAHWNNWTDTLYFIKDKSLYTMQYYLQLAIKEADTLQKIIADAIATGRPLGDINSDISGESLQAAQMIVTTLPILMVYPFVQKYFMSGVMLGSVKE